MEQFIIPRSTSVQALFREKLKPNQKNFYCVFRGREIGIFTTWPACEQRINGFSHCSYKGFTTLEAAVEAMRQAGISEPILFHKLNDSSQVPSVNRFTITHDKTTLSLIDDNTNSVSEIDPSSSLSDETIVKVLFTPPNVKSPQLNVENADSETEVYFNTNQDSSNSFFTSQNPLSQSDDIDKSMGSAFATHQDDTTIISMLNEISMKQDRFVSECMNEVDHVKHQNDILRVDISSLKDQNDLISSKLDQAQSYMLESHLCWEKARNDLLESTNQLKSAYSKIDKLNQQIDCLTKINSDLVSAQQTKLNVHFEKDNCNENTIDNKAPNFTDKSILPHQVSMNQSPPVHTAQNFDIVNSTSKQDSSNCVKPGGKTASMTKSQEYLESETSLCDSDSNIDLSSIAPRYRSSISSNDKENGYVSRNYLNIPSTCKNLLIGDSNMKNVQKRRYDRSGQTEIRTYRGASIKTLDNIMQKCSNEYSQVQKISICIGTIDCSKNHIDCEQIVHDYDNLLATVKEVFPAASISILAIPPQNISQANKFIKNVNSNLQKLSKRHYINFNRCLSLWQCVGSDGKVDQGLLNDRVHLSQKGLSFLLKNVSRFFFQRNKAQMFGDRRDPTFDMRDMSSFPALSSRIPPPYHQATYASKLKMPARIHGLPVLESLV